MKLRRMKWYHVLEILWLFGWSIAVLVIKDRRVAIVLGVLMLIYAFVQMYRLIVQSQTLSGKT